MTEITSGQIISLSSIFAILIMGISAIVIKEKPGSFTLDSFIESPFQYYFYMVLVPNVLGVAKIIGVAILLAFAHIITDDSSFKIIAILVLLLGMFRFIQILWDMANNYLRTFE